MAAFIDFSKAFNKINHNLIITSVSELVDVYQKQVRSVLELAVPVWQPALTGKEKTQIERVQKMCLTHYPWS